MRNLETAVIKPSKYGRVKKDGSKRFENNTSLRYLFVLCFSPLLSGRSSDQAVDVRPNKKQQAAYRQAEKKYEVLSSLVIVLSVRLFYDL
jgi:hypothetical protein